LQSPTPAALTTPAHANVLQQLPKHTTRPPAIHAFDYKRDKILDSGASVGIAKSVPTGSTGICKVDSATENFGGNEEFAFKASHRFNTPISNHDLLVPQTKIDIVSVPQADMKNLATLFYAGSGIIWNPANCHVLETATLSGGLYHIDDQPRFKSVQMDLSRFPRQ
jgi:hypothetical protein